MDKKVYAIWLGDAWFTSASSECMQTTDSDLPITTFDNEADAVRAYNSAVNCGAVVHEEGNAIVRIKCERV